MCSMCVKAMGICKALCVLKPTRGQHKDMEGKNRSCSSESYIKITDASFKESEGHLIE